jgi:hypothetical protein
MKKLTVLVAMLAMMLATAAPALAQTAVNDSVARDNSTTTTYDAVAQNVVGDIETGDAIQRGDASADAEDDSVARASVDAELDTSVSLSNEVGDWEGWDDWSWWWF